MVIFPDSDNRLNCLNLNSKKTSQRIKGHTNAVECVAIMRDQVGNTIIATGGRDRIVKVWVRKKLF